MTACSSRLQVFGIFRDQKVSVDVVATSEISISLTLDPRRAAALTPSAINGARACMHTILLSSRQVACNYCVYTFCKAFRGQSATKQLLNIAAGKARSMKT